MKKGLVNVAFILDRSGSMQEIWGDAEGAYKKFIAEQQAIPGEMLFSLVLFDDRYDIVQDMVPIKDARPIRPEDGPRGMTALVDACCRTIDHLGQRMAAMPEDEKPERTIVAIMTDGYENQSKEFTAADLKKRVTDQADKWGWTFLFLGANQDSFDTAKGFGIATKGVANFASTPDGTQSAVRSLSRSVMSSRTGDADGDGRLLDVSTHSHLVTK